MTSATFENNQQVIFYEVAEFGAIGASMIERLSSSSRAERKAAFRSLEPMVKTGILHHPGTKYKLAALSSGVDSTGRAILIAVFQTISLKVQA
jgi:hypothetical protein